MREFKDRVAVVTGGGSGAPLRAGLDEWTAPVPAGVAVREALRRGSRGWGERGAARYSPSPPERTAFVKVFGFMKT